VTLDDRGRRAARDFRTALDDATRPPAGLGSLERFDRYRRDRERSSRVGVVVVATVVSVAALVLLVRALDPGRRHVPAVVSHAAGVIVVNENVRPNGPDLFRSFTIRPDGTHRTPVGPAGATVCGGNDDPWSPGGSRILCMIFRPDMTVGTATMDADGSNFRPVSARALPANFGCGAWSPDGTRLLCPFTSDWVYTVKPNGTDLVRLSSMRAGEGPSGFAEDGARAYFTVLDAVQHRTLYSVRTDGTGTPRRLSPPGVSVHDNNYFDGVSADASPDGSEVAFAADVTSTEKALYVVNVDGTDEHRLAMPPGINPTSAQWSPDGEWIVFSAEGSASDPTSEVYVIHPDGSGFRAVTSSAEDCGSYAPVWSPDGAHLLFATQCHSGSSVTSTTLEIANVDGTALSKVTDLNSLTAYGWGDPASD
jgi:WD40-like Beta Propeller Repeat